ARESPSFKLEDVTGDPQAFTLTSIALEDLSVAAYNGQVANVSRSVLTLATKIVSVEGRHAAWIRDLAGKLPAPRAADLELAARDVLHRLAALDLVEGL